VVVWKEYVSLLYGRFEAINLGKGRLMFTFRRFLFSFDTMEVTVRSVQSSSIHVQQVSTEASLGTSK